jgi:CRISPR type III-B/RAMP module RAMP protein Cmr1
MKKIECEIEILTPMFLGGAKQSTDGKAIAEVRTQSIKGVLRYWYRALVGPTGVCQAESEIFGSSDERIGASKVRLVLSRRDFLQHYQKTQFSEIKEFVFKHPTKGFPMNPLNYLAYGPVDNSKKIARTAFSPGGTFVLSLSYHRLDELQLSDLRKSLYLFLTFGGLGGRSRKGYGAVNLLNATTVLGDQEWFVLGNPGRTLKNIINGKGPIRPTYQKEYPNLDTDTKLWVSKNTATTWEEGLSMLGRDYHQWRQVLKVKNGRENLGTPLLHGSPMFEQKRRSSPYYLTLFKLDQKSYRYGVLHIPSNYSKDTPIPPAVQQQAHDAFQGKIAETAMREV